MCASQVSGTSPCTCSEGALCLCVCLVVVVVVCGGGGVSGRWHSCGLLEGKMDFLQMELGVIHPL